MQRLVIVEDDRDLNRGLCLALKNEEMDIVSCLDLGQARQALEQAADLLAPPQPSRPVLPPSKITISPGLGASRRTFFAGAAAKQRHTSNFVDCQ